MDSARGLRRNSVAPWFFSSRLRVLAIRQIRKTLPGLDTAASPRTPPTPLGPPAAAAAEGVRQAQRRTPDAHPVAPHLAEGAVKRRRRRAIDVEGVGDAQVQA